MTTRRLFVGLAASAALISVLTVLSRLTGFARTLVFSSTVGAACVGGTYNTANLVPTVLFEVAAGGALSATVIPLLAPLLPDRPAQAERLAGAVLTWTVTLLVPLTAVLALLARPMAEVLVSGGLCEGQREQTAAMLVVFAPQVLLYGVGAVLAGVLQARGRFAWPAFAPVLSSVVVIAAYVVYDVMVGDAPASRTDAALSDGAFAVLTWGTTAGVAAMTLPLLIPVYRSGFRLRPTWTFPSGTARRTAALAGAGVLAVLAQQGFQLAAVVLANHGGNSGTVVTFGFAQAVTVLPYAVLVAPLITALFPRLARAAEGSTGQGSIERRSEQGRAASPGAAFTDLSARSIRLVLIAGAGAAALLAASAPAMAALFTRLDKGRVTSMSEAVLVGAPGLVALALVMFIGRTLYAVGAPRAAAVGTSTGWLAAVVLAAAGLLITSPDGAVIALTGGQSLGTAVGAAVLLGVLRRRASVAATAGLARAGLVLVPAATLAGGLGWALARWLVGVWDGGPLGAVLAAVVATSVAGLLYAVAALLVATDLLGVPPAGPGSRNAAALGDDAVVPAGSIVQLLGISAGGIGRHVLALATGLSGAGRSVVVIGPSETLDAFGYAATGLETRELAVGERPDPVRDLDGIRRLTALTRGAAVIHAHGIRAAALAVLAARGVPVVVTVHNAPPAAGFAGLIYRLLERLVARRAAVVLAVSGDLVARLRGLGARRVDRALVPSPLHPVPSAERAEVAARLRLELGVGPDERLALTVGRLAPQKGLGVLLEAAAWLRELPVRWVVVGDGPLHDELAAQITARTLPVSLLGVRDDVPALLVAADIVVVPSLWEGQPLIVQEALAAGAAIVATDAGGTAEVLGEAALLVRPGDAEQLAGAVRIAVTDPERARDLRERARERAVTLPTQDDALAQAMRVYHRLITDSLESRGAAHI